MKIFIWMLVICLLSTLVYADKLIIPFDCFPEELQAKFAENGIKLDLDRNVRTEDSWGFLINEGQTYTLYTYEHVTDSDLTLIKSIVMGEEDG